MSRHRGFHPTQVIILVIFFIALSAWFITRKVAYPIPVLEPGVYVQDGGVHIDVGLWSVPLVYDWDDDDREDLLVGLRWDDDEESHGYVRFYKNWGTDNLRIFSGFSLLDAGGRCCLDVPVEG